MPRYADERDPSTVICNLSKRMCARLGPPHEPVVAITLLWMYVGILKRRKKFADRVRAVTGVDARLSGLFKTAVAQDKYENSEHIINVWNAILEVSPHMRGLLPISSDILARAYPNLNLNLPPDQISYKPDKFFAAVASRMPPPPPNHTKDGQNKEKGETDTKSQPEVGTSSVQTVFKPATRNHSPPAKKYKEEDMVNLEPVGDHVVKLEQTSAPNIAKMAEEKGEFPQNATRSRQPKVEEAGKCEKTDEAGSGPRDEPDVAKSDLSPPDPDVLLFVTDPYAMIRLNPSLFPSEGVGWSASSLLPSDGRKRPEKKGEDVPDPPELPPLPVLPTVPAGCTETLLGIDFTPEEYLEQTIADNYYAQGIKLVDGVRRVVFYHLDSNGATS
ncbi:uncharacterized protein LOC118439182 [Folsomia candida]|uniref:uncharacterized protein LOC118439182 n=1 Tax=Folsomia candida TaxID=158441 RepID=UPI001604A2E8|nr:uncharacterized protein LOC118439182 [Folsomia candida]XP_035716166.1 uncharacterized protein LOC118439182 [Folsomia candida]XP_035716167.1 uncharacterized protein LOC118439182 [Folsomia candida]XP_035716168.1 uncharacterized protein LOC118439182 [Folsomia candida]XP_035716169.1 uncharacterized protein LOC118439182 [Folsomia candida]